MKPPPGPHREREGPILRPLPSYAQAGVDLEAARQAEVRLLPLVRSTHGPEVLSGFGGFAGLFALPALEEPVLVSSVDGVGTKTAVAARMNRWDTVGEDLVNHCLNDVLVCGARPLFFLDYLASARLDPEQVEAVVAGVARACRAAGMALVGGETAEMPGVYCEGQVDLVGAVVGVVERSRILDGRDIRPGDRLVGFPSSGLHTNGYSLARRILDDCDWEAPHPELGQPLGEALLAPHRSYLEPVAALRGRARGLCHVTGGGLVGNLPRILPEGTGAVLHRGSWPEPPLFSLLQRLGGVSEEEMFRVFNMGLGMVACLPPEEPVPEGAFAVGEVVEGGGVEIR